MTLVLGGAQEDLRKQLGSANREVRREATVEIRKMGAKAKPYLSELIIALDDPDKQVWYNAIAAISAIGTDAAEAIPVLIKDMDSRKERGKRTAELRQAVHRNAYALGCIGSVAVPSLIEALHSEDVITRQGAAKALEYIGDKAQEAIPALYENLSHPHAELRADVVSALSVIALQSTEKIIALLDAEKLLERQGALLVLGKMGKAAEETTGRLFQMTESEKEPAVRASLLETLVAIHADRERVYPLLMKGVQDADAGIRHVAVNGLLIVDPEGRRALPEIIVLLKSEDPIARQFAASVAGSYGETAAEAVPALVAIANDKPADSRYARDALAKIGTAAAREMIRSAGPGDTAQITREHWVIGCIAKMGAAATPELLKSLESKEATMRLVAVLGCTAINGEAAPAMEMIVRSCADTDARVRAAAFEALPAIEVDRDRLLPLIEVALEDPEPSVRISAMAQISYLKEAGKPLAPSLLAMMGDSSPELRKAAVRAINSQMDEAIPQLVKSLDDETLRADAIESLGRFGTRAQPAVSKLVEILPGETSETRRRIITTMSLTGSADVVAALAGALKDEDAGCRAAAVSAYLKVEKDAAAKISVTLSMLDDSDISVRRAAADALPLLGDRAKEATSKLVKMLQVDTDREFAIETMRRISMSSIPDLIEILENPDPSARLFAVQRLGQIGPTAGDAAASLKTLAQDDKQSEKIRGEAQHALRRIGR